MMVYLNLNIVSGQWERCGQPYMLAHSDRQYDGE